METNKKGIKNIDFHKFESKELSHLIKENLQEIGFTCEKEPFEDDDGNPLIFVSKPEVTIAIGGCEHLEWNEIPGGYMYDSGGTHVGCESDSDDFHTMEELVRRLDSLKDISLPLPIPGR